MPQITGLLQLKKIESLRLYFHTYRKNIFRHSNLKMTSLFQILRLKLYSDLLREVFLYLARYFRKTPAPW